MKRNPVKYTITAEEKQMTQAANVESGWQPQLSSHQL